MRQLNTEDEGIQIADAQLCGRRRRPIAAENAALLANNRRLHARDHPHSSPVPIPSGASSSSARSATTSRRRRSAIDGGQRALCGAAWLAAPRAVAVRLTRGRHPLLRRRVALHVPRRRRAADDPVARAGVRPGETAARSSPSARVQPRADRAVALRLGTLVAAASVVDGGDGLACASPPSPPPASGSVRCSASRMTAAAEAGAVADDRPSPITPRALPLTLSSAAPEAWADAAAATTTVEVAGANFAPLGDAAALPLRRGGGDGLSDLRRRRPCALRDAHAPVRPPSAPSTSASRATAADSWSDGALPFTFYDARRPPSLSSLVPAYASPMRAPPAVTLRGANSAPLAALALPLRGAPPVLARFRSGGEV